MPEPYTYTFISEGPELDAIVRMLQAQCRWASCPRCNPRGLRATPAARLQNSQRRIND
jgi:hypothetical protein